MTAFRLSPIVLLASSLFSQINIPPPHLRDGGDRPWIFHGRCDIFQATEHRIAPCRVEDLWAPGFINRFHILIQDEWRPDDDWNKSWSALGEMVTVRNRNGRMVLEADSVGVIVVTPIDERIREFLLYNDGAFETLKQDVHVNRQRRLKQILIEEPALN